ncbi:MAG: apolipoprotein N-acyltransferase [Alphaproteobacteria bacterium]
MSVLTVMSGAAAWVGGLAGVRRACFAFLLGALAVLAFAPVHAWPVMFLSFGGLVWLLDDCAANDARGARLKCGGATGFWFGCGFFLAGLYWLAEAFLVEPTRHAWLIPFVMTALSAGMALFYAAAGVLAMALWQPGPGRIFALAIAFGLAEYARGHVLTGLPWNLIGYALLPEGPLMQMAALLGVYTLCVLAVALFAAPAATWSGQNTCSKCAAGVAATLLVLLGLGYVWGDRRLAATTDGDTDLRLRIVQANIDQADKWRPENAAKIFGDYVELTRAPGLEDTDLVIWPETALPFFLADTSEALTAIGDALPQGTHLLVGAARAVQERDADAILSEERVYNSLLLLDENGRVREAYDKVHLVPFGEYLPFQDFLESLGVMQMTGVRGGFSEGTGSRLLEVPGAPLMRPLICYEIIFPGEVGDTRVRPGWLLNVTNDAWFGTSAGPYQHFHQAQVRAVEQGLPLVRAANTGISAVIDAQGRVLAEIGLGERGLIDAVLPNAGPHLGEKHYTLVLCFVLFALLCIVLYFRRTLQP